MEALVLMDAHQRAPIIKWCGDLNVRLFNCCGSQCALTQLLRNLPRMCKEQTTAMKTSDITKTVVGPTFRPVPSCEKRRVNFVLGITKIASGSHANTRMSCDYR